MKRGNVSVSKREMRMRVNELLRDDCDEDWRGRVQMKLFEGIVSETSV